MSDFGLYDQLLNVTDANNLDMDDCLDDTTQVTTSSTALSPRNIPLESIVNKTISYCCRAPARQHTILDDDRGFPRVHSTQSFAPIYV